MHTSAVEVLVFVSVLFRHGERSPKEKNLKLFGNNTDFDDFYPIGFGGLTNEGKLNEYKLGTKLRERYNDFLGDVFIPEHVEARSTDSPRTRMSLDLVLAGLYPPSKIQRWNQELNWQPIPTSSVPTAQDTLLRSYKISKEYSKEVKRVKKLPEVVEKTDKYRALEKKLSKDTGTSITSVGNLFLVHDALMALQATNHKLPEWSQGIFPDGALRDAASLYYEIYNYNDLLKKLNGGPLLKRTIDDMKIVMESNEDRYRRKINLFSGHQEDVAGLLATLGLFKPHVPEYSSGVILELIQRKDVYYVKVVRYLGTPDEFEEQEISNCETPCPFDKFINLMKKVTPTDKEINKSKKCK